MAYNLSIEGPTPTDANGIVHAQSALHLAATEAVRLLRVNGVEARVTAYWSGSPLHIDVDGVRPSSGVPAPPPTPIPEPLPGPEPPAEEEPAPPAA